MNELIVALVGQYLPPALTNEIQFRFQCHYVKEQLSKSSYYAQSPANIHEHVTETIRTLSLKKSPLSEPISITYHRWKSAVDSLPSSTRTSAYCKLQLLLKLANFAQLPIPEPQPVELPPTDPPTIELERISLDYLNYRDPCLDSDEEDDEPTRVEDMALVPFVAPPEPVIEAPPTISALAPVQRVQCDAVAIVKKCLYLAPKPRIEHLEQRRLYHDLLLSMLRLLWVRCECQSSLRRVQKPKNSLSSSFLVFFSGTLRHPH